MRYFALVVCAAFFTSAPTEASTLQSPAAIGQDSVKVVVMSTMELHGWVLPWDYYTDQPEPRRALSKVASLVDSVRAAHEHTLLLDSGDWLQGNPMAEYFARVDTLNRYPLLRTFDLMRYDAVVLGNHEFNFGIDYLNRRIAQTATPILGANVYFHGTAEPAYAPYILREVGGVTFGIVGLKTPGSAIWDRAHVEGRLDFADGVETARRFVDKVRRLGADVVVILAHSGFDRPTAYDDPALGEENFGRSIVEQVEGVDVVVLGHTLRVLTEVMEGVDGRPVGVIMPGHYPLGLGVVELRIVRDGAVGRYRVARQEVRTIPSTHAPSHPAVEDLVRNAHEAVRAHMNQPLATIDGRWTSSESRLAPSPIIDLIHRTQLTLTGAQLSAASAFHTRAALGPDVVTLGQVFGLYHYENTLNVVEITGRDLRAYIEHGAQYYLPPEAPGDPPSINPVWAGFDFDMVAGAEYELDLARPVGQRVARLTVNGEEVGDEDVYSMAVNSYRAGGGGGFPGMGRQARVIEHIDVSVRDLIAEYVRQRGDLRTDEIMVSSWSLAPLPGE